MRRVVVVVGLATLALIGGCRASSEPVPSSTRPPTTIASTSSSPAPAASALPPTDVTRPPDVASVLLRVESRARDISVATVRALVEETLADKRGWVRAGFRFTVSPDAEYRVIVAEGPEVDRLCKPLETGGTVSCQNGPVVAINATRWREGVEHWDGSLLEYRRYVINHEVGHLVGQRHPSPLCPRGGRPAAVMAQQTKSLGGCTGNGWPREWEIELASARPVVLAPDPDWKPGPPPRNQGT